MKTEDIRVVLATFPDLGKARQIATQLVELQLVACANLVPAVESIYQWENKIETGSEVLVILKTRELLLNRLEEKLSELHPYDVPEFIVLSVDSGAEKYVNWIREVTNQQGQ